MDEATLSPAAAIAEQLAALHDDAPAVVVEQLKLSDGSPFIATALRTRALGYAYTMVEAVYPELEPLMRDAAVTFKAGDATQETLKLFVVDLCTAAVRATLRADAGLDAWRGVLIQSAGMTAERFDNLTEDDHIAALIAMVRVNGSFFARAMTPTMRANLAALTVSLSIFSPSTLGSEPSGLA